jgi:DNA uptake protein ComE-like DNA-binding protein
MYSRSTLISLFILALFFTPLPGRAMSFLDRHSWHFYSIAEIEQEERTRPGVQAATCERGTMGWEFFCDLRYADPRIAERAPRRVAGMSSFLSPVAWDVPLRPDRPVPTPEQIRHRVKLADEDSKRNRKIVYLDTATEAELATLPGVDPALAARIVAAKTRKPFTRVDDLLTVEGLGFETFDRIEAFVRLKR